MTNANKDGKEKEGAASKCEKPCLYHPSEVVCCIVYGRAGLRLSRRMGHSTRAAQQYPYIHTKSFHCPGRSAIQKLGRSPGHQMSNSDTSGVVNNSRKEIAMALQAFVSKVRECRILTSTKPLVYVMSIDSARRS